MKNMEQNGILWARNIEKWREVRMFLSRDIKTDAQINGCSMWTMNDEILPWDLLHCNQNCFSADHKRYGPIAIGTNKYYWRNVNFSEGKSRNCNSFPPTKTVIEKYNHYGVETFAKFRPQARLEPMITLFGVHVFPLYYWGAWFAFLSASFFFNLNGAISNYSSTGITRAAQISVKPC